MTLNSSSKKTYNHKYDRKDSENETQRGSYLDIWEKIPSYKDLNLTIFALKTLFIWGYSIFLFIFIYITFENIYIAGIIPLIIISLFLFTYQKNIFRTVISERGRIYPFEHFVFFRLNGDPYTIFLTNKKDLITTGIRIFKIRIMAENVHPNINQFVKSLSISRIPFSYQIVQLPHGNNIEKNARKIDVYFSISYKISGMISNIKYETLKTALEEFSYIMKSNFVANFPHYKMQMLSDNELIKGLQTFYFKKSSENNGPNQRSYYHSFYSKITTLVILIITFDIFSFIIEIHMIIVIASNICIVSIIVVLFWREIIFHISQLNAFGENLEIINPFNNYKFFYFRNMKETIFTHIDGRILIGFKALQLKVATSPQFVNSEYFIAKPDKFFRAMIHQQIPFTYSLFSSPIDYATFEREGKKYLNQFQLEKILQINSREKQIQWLNMRTGIWRTTLILSYFKSVFLRDLSIEDIEELEYTLNLETQSHINTFHQTYSNYYLETLKKKKLISGFFTTIFKSKFFNFTGSLLNYILFQGKTVSNLIEIANEFKKGIETKMGVEFNAPTDLNNFIEIGKTFNQEILEREIPAGFTLNQVKRLLISNGVYQSREGLLLKIVAELVIKKIPSIIFDYSGNFSKLINYFKDSEYQNQFLTFKLGKSLRVNIKNSGLSNDKNILEYYSYISDAFSMIFKVNQIATNQVKETLKSDKSLHTIKLDMENNPDWVKSPYSGEIISLLEDFSKGNIIFYEDKKNDEDSKQEVDLERIDDSNQKDIIDIETLINETKTIIIDLSILTEIEHKLFISMMYVSKFIHYLKYGNQYQEKILVIPNSDLLFDSWYLDQSKHIKYGKVNKFLEPLFNHNFGIITTSNEIRFFHPNFFNYFRNIATFRTNDTRDVATLKHLINLQELHGQGYYSSSRKESYQIYSLFNLENSEVILKRDDYESPFPVIIENDDLLVTHSLEFEEINEYMLNQGYDLRKFENQILLNSKKTIFERHFGSYSQYLDEIIQFLGTLKKVDSIGNLYEQKIKEELLKEIYPKASQKYQRNKRAIKKIRDGIYWILEKYRYIREDHPRTAGGSQSLRTSYSVGEQFDISLEDYMNLKSHNKTNISVESVHKESDEVNSLNSIFPQNGEENKLNTNSKEKEFSFTTGDIRKVVERCLYKQFFSDLAEIKLQLKFQNEEEVLFIERDILRKFLSSIYNEFHPHDKIDFSDKNMILAIEFLTKSLDLSFTKDYFQSLLEMCKLDTKKGEELWELLRDNFEVLMKFFHQLREDIVN
ncbi:MAG: hypothetical protein GF317_13295 [Candidatus Lokiarchaeota archaeon]|nr:hypothetical protein [Candidatus Lokiarchaeota archaeon]MBD3200612.1 hypothetical protein [Candidatus Lokiarchaeota archaeon]